MSSTEQNTEMQPEHEKYFQQINRYKRISQKSTSHIKKLTSREIIYRIVIGRNLRRIQKDRRQQRDFVTYIQEHVENGMPNTYDLIYMYICRYKLRDALKDNSIDSANKAKEYAGSIVKGWKKAMKKAKLQNEEISESEDTSNNEENQSLEVQNSTDINEDETEIASENSTGEPDFPQASNIASISTNENNERTNLKENAPSEVDKFIESMQSGDIILTKEQLFRILAEIARQDLSSFSQDELAGVAQLTAQIHESICQRLEEYRLAS